MVDLDELAEADRQWLDAEADRIAADPATLVRMMIRQARLGPQTVAERPQPTILVEPYGQYARRQGQPDRMLDQLDANAENGTPVDIDAIVDAQLAEIDPGVASTETPHEPAAKVQSVGERPLTPFHIPRGPV